MDLAYLDYLAVNATTPLHRSTALDKLLALAGLLAALLFASHLAAALVLLAGEVAGLVLARQPLRRLALASTFPLFFAGLFALTRLASQPSLAGLVMVRAYASALAVVTLLATTPFWEIFAVLGRLLPGLVADAVLMAYRAFFLLLGRFSNLLVTLRLRRLSDRFTPGSLMGYGAVLGSLTLSAFDLTERQYRIMRLRGYSGPLAGAAPLALAPPDLPLFLAAGLLAGATVWAQLALR
ncbi:MAG: CbiQ family ECF transporter T component [Chitinophagales bacterium]